MVLIRFPGKVNDSAGGSAGLAGLFIYQRCERRVATKPREVRVRKLREWGLTPHLSRLNNAKSQNRGGTSRDQTPHPNRLELRSPAHKNTEDDATKNDPSAAAYS